MQEGHPSERGQFVHFGPLQYTEQGWVLGLGAALLSLRAVRRMIIADAGTCCA